MPLSHPAISAAMLWAALAAAACAALAGAFVLPPLAVAAAAVLAFGMALVTLTDIRHYIIPDIVSLPLVPLGAAANMAVFHADGWLAGLTESAWGAVLGGGAFLLLRVLYRRIRGVHGLGLGDVKLAAVAGAWLGPELLPSLCLVATLGALAAVLLRLAFAGRGSISRETMLPFGSFIAPAILAFWLARTAGGW